MKIRKNDTVIVISGNARGKKGKVLKVFPDRPAARGRMRWGTTSGF